MEITYSCLGLKYQKTQKVCTVAMFTLHKMLFFPLNPYSHGILLF